MKLWVKINDGIDIDQMKEKTKLIKKKTAEMKASGISNSIRYCLNHRREIIKTLLDYLLRLFKLKISTFFFL